MAERAPDNQKRRDFLVKLTQGAALAGVAALPWAYMVRNEARAAPYALRPPGALSEDDFNAACIKCGQCVNDCPPAILKLQPAGGDLPIGTPFFEPRTGACVMCPDIPCMKACPTGALSPRLERIEDARMGLATIDPESCLSFQGLRCEICHRECPLKGRAITLETHPRELSKHAIFVPRVHSEACTGCGICEQACPTEVAAIRILPPALVQGKMGEHYRLGWTEKSEITEHFQPSDAPAPEKAPAKVPGLDYLNEGGL